MVVVKTVGVEVFEMGDIATERIDVGFLEPVAEHFGESALVGDLDDSGAAGFKNAIKLVGDGLHVFEMVSGADHHERIDGVIGKRWVVNVAGFGMDFVAIEFLGLGEFGFRIVKNGGGFGAGKIFVGEAAVTAGDVNEFVHMLR